MSNTIAFEEKETRDWLRKLLHQGKMEITFMKADGSDRVMICTLQEDKIPEAHTPKNSSSRAKSDETQTVFDLEKQEWRSFRWDSIKQLNFKLGDDDEN